MNHWGDDPARIAERRSESAHIAELIAGLPPRQREVVLLHYFNGSSLRSVGKRLAISPQRASQLHLARLPNLKRECRARRIELDETPAALSARLEAGRSEAIVPAVAEAELETALLPQDHPRWKGRCRLAASAGAYRQTAPSYRPRPFVLGSSNPFDYGR